VKKKKKTFENNLKSITWHNDRSNVVKGKGFCHVQCIWNTILQMFFYFLNK